MNKLILNTGVQDFIENNLNTDIVSVLLQKQVFEGVSQKELATQLEAKKKSRSKLPTWFATPKVYYPNKLNIEQTSSEGAAEYKSRLVSGKNLLDLTGGFGVDSFYFAKKMECVFHCEKNAKLSEIAAYNFTVLGAQNIKAYTGDGLQFLTVSNRHYDWIYVDPSRRHDVKGKVFLLKDCEPNLPEKLSLLFSKSKNVLIKTSPLLDIKQGISELEYIKEIHVVAIQNEVKELLFVLEHKCSNDIVVNTINLNKDIVQEFSFELEKESVVEVTYQLPQAFLYEPNSAILKSGGFKSIGVEFELHKLHQHSHLYTSDKLLDFPGRCFKIEKVLPYTKKNLQSYRNKKVNITTRNFPVSVADLRKKFKLKDGGEDYLFFSKNHLDDLIIIQTKKCGPSQTR